MSQSELSRRSGVSLVTVNAIANNRTKQVSLETLNNLCKALGSIRAIYSRERPTVSRQPSLPARPSDQPSHD